MQKKKLLSIGEASQYLGLSRDTLRRWEKKGKITAFRSPTNRRYYTKEQLDKLIKGPSEIKKSDKQEKRKTKFSKLIIFGIVGFIAAAIIISVLQMSITQ